MECKNSISSKAAHSSWHSFISPFFPLSTPSFTCCLFLLPHEEGEQGARKRLTKSHSCFLSNSVLLDLVIIFIPTQLQQKDNFLSLFFINKCFRREIEDVSKLSNTTQGLVPSDFCALQTHTNAAVCLSLNVSRSKGAVGKRKIKQDLKRDVKASLCHILQISSSNHFQLFRVLTAKNILSYFSISFLPESFFF